MFFVHFTSFSSKESAVRHMHLYVCECVYITLKSELQVPVKLPHHYFWGNNCSYKTATRNTWQIIKKKKSKERNVWHITKARFKEDTLQRRFFYVKSNYQVTSHITTCEWIFHPALTAHLTQIRQNKTKKRHHVNRSAL